MPNRTTRARHFLLALLALPLFWACGGNPGTPTPVNTRWTLTLLVTTEGATPIAGAALRVLDGPNQGRTATTDAAGLAVVSELQQGGFTVEVTADLFNPLSVPVTLTGNLSLTVRMSVRPVANPPPRIAALRASNGRAERGEEIEVVATVEDEETPPGQLEYTWAAANGTFTGTGSQVRWRAPGEARTPAAYDLTLTVVEKYTALDPSGQPEVRENRVSATVVVHVNDSPDEVEDLVIRFLDDFANYAVSPEDCVRSFSDSCAGKDAELDDVRENRRTRQIISGTYRVSEMLFNGEKTYAWVRAPCAFRSFLKDATGAVTTTLETATGTCLFEAVYEQWAWWLCDSKWQGSTSTGLRFAF